MLLLLVAILYNATTQNITRYVYKTYDPTWQYATLAVCMVIVLIINIWVRRREEQRR